MPICMPGNSIPTVPPAASTAGSHGYVDRTAAIPPHYALIMKTAAELLWTIRRLARGRQAVAADRWSMANVKVVAYELARLRAKCVAPFQTLAPPPDTAALGSLVCMSQ